ncbi:MAG: B12-binding domain-containing radical SAM protein [Candidatus Lokiarchaeota archaeon]|nr:B12-binding domain-containing radical SAM protein [Candidatus Lokiarchaeota archaeon]
MKKKFKIYFLEPNFAQVERPSFDEFMEPLNLCYLAAVAKNAGHEVFVKQQFNNTNEELIDDILRFNPDILAVTLITLFVNRARYITSEIKKINPEIISIVGGSHVTGDPEETAKYFDYVIVGEGENPFLNLLCELPNNRKPNLPGVGYFSDGKFFLNNYRVRNTNILQLPVRDNLDFSRYTGIGNGPPPMPKVGFASMLLSKGCRFDCDFCVNKSIWKDSSSKIIPVVKRNPEDVVSEMKLLSERYNIGYVWFQDADFPLYDRKYMKSFFQIKSSNSSIKYSFMSRIDNIILRNDFSEAEDFLFALKKSGCHMIGFGLESFSPQLLKRMKKSITLEKVKKVLELVFNAGIIPVAFFIIGYPDETRERLEATYNIAKTLKILRFRFAIFYPFVGTLSLSRIKKEDWLIPPNDSYDFADNEHQVIKCNLEKGELEKYFKFMNSKIYFEKEYLETLEEFYSLHIDMQPTISNWSGIIDSQFKRD